MLSTHTVSRWVTTSTLQIIHGMEQGKVLVMHAPDGLYRPTVSLWHTTNMPSYGTLQHLMPWIAFSRVWYVCQWHQLDVYCVFPTNGVNSNSNSSDQPQLMEQLLQASGGELNPSKCAWFCFCWQITPQGVALIMNHQTWHQTWCYLSTAQHLSPSND